MPQMDHDNFYKIIVMQTNVHYVLRCNAKTLSCDFSSLAVSRGHTSRQSQITRLEPEDTMEMWCTHYNNYTYTFAALCVGIGMWFYVPTFMARLLIAYCSALPLYTMCIFCVNPRLG